MQRARQALVAKEPHDALAHCNKGLQIDEEDSFARCRLFNNRGVSYDRLGKYIPAIYDLSMAIKLRPSAWQPVHNRYLAYRDIGATKEALQVSCPAHCCICQACHLVLRCHWEANLAIPFIPLHSTPYHPIPFYSIPFVVPGSP